MKHEGYLIIIGIVISMAFAVLLTEKKIEKEGGKSEWIWERK